MTHAGHSDLRALKIEMQDFDFNPTQLSEVINYIILAGGGEIPAPKVEEEIQFDPEYKAKLIEQGAKLFQGIEKFREEGMACLLVIV